MLPSRIARALLPLRNAGSRLYGYCFDPLDYVTGIEKRELLAHLAGDCDPFRMLSIKRGPGTRECPTLIPSSSSFRLVGCVCHPECNHVEYIVLHYGEPKRCYCGYWFELCPMARFAIP